MPSTGRVLSVFCLCSVISLPAAADDGQPRYPKPVQRPRPPAGPDGQPLVTVDGRWYSNFGYMDLEQEQWSFTGSYSCCSGKIRGELLADKIEFFWQDPIYGEGWGHFLLRDQGRVLAGTWGLMHDMGSAGGWKAVRLAEREYDGEPTHWRFTASHPQLGEVKGEAVLHVVGDALAGKLEGVGETLTQQDRVYRHEIFRYLEGRRQGDSAVLEWLNPLTERQGEIRLTWASDRLEGTWHITEEIVEPITFERLEAVEKESGREPVSADSRPQSTEGDR